MLLENGTIRPRRSGNGFFWCRKGIAASRSAFRSQSRADNASCSMKKLAISGDLSLPIDAAIRASNRGRHRPGGDEDTDQSVGTNPRGFNPLIPPPPDPLGGQLSAINSNAAATRSRPCPARAGSILAALASVSISSINSFNLSIIGGELRTTLNPSPSRPISGFRSIPRPRPLPLSPAKAPVKPTQRRIRGQLHNFALALVGGFSDPGSGIKSGHEAIFHDAGGPAVLSAAPGRGRGMTGLAHSCPGAVGQSLPSFCRNPPSRVRNYHIRYRNGFALSKTMPYPYLPALVVTQAACSTACVMVLQTFGKRPQAPVEGCRIIPESCVSRVRHHLNLRVS